jgi:DNA-binding beta-propeller fold protein YncE
MIALLAGCAAVPNELSRPNRLAVGPDGTLYVSDFHHDRIVVFPADGGPPETFGERGIGRGQLWRVTAMAVGPDGHLLVANRRPETEDRGSEIRFEIVEFDRGSEVTRTLIDQRTLQPDGWVDAIAQAPDGNLVVADSTNGELVEVDATGMRLGRFGGVPRIDAAPSGLRRAGDDVWVVEQYRHRVSRIGRDGNPVILPLKDAPDDLPRFPSAIGVCAGQWVAIGDFGNHRVERYALDGARVGGFEPAPVGEDSPVELIDLDVSPDCAKLYLVDSKGDRVLITDPDGTVIDTIDRW